MEKEENYSAHSMPCNFSTGIDYTIDYHHQQQSHVGETSTNEENDGMVNYLLSNNQQQIQQQHHNFSTSSSFDKLSFADVMQFADFGPKLALNQTKIPNYEDSGMDSVFFLKFPVLNHDKFEDKSLNNILTNPAVQDQDMIMRYREDDEARVSGNNNNNNNNNPSLAHMQLQFLGDHEDGFHKTNPNTISEPTKNNTKRKRPRSVKTTEEVESQRMTHIAVERNRRKQMNEHLRVLRSLMPGSYVQRGDQASIIGGAIEFVRELEQLLQCLESQKRRRLVGDQESRVIQIGGTTDSANNNIAVVPAGIVQPDHHQPIVPYFPGATLPLPPDQIKFVDFETGLREETAENKSCLADVEVKLLGFDAIIKILSRRRPSQLIKTIAALEDLQFNILHTNITTIEQTVLYSFNVKVVGETRFNAEDIASSVQQIFSFIHANSTI